jgi:hypothetical protein
MVKFEDYVKGSLDDIKTGMRDIREEQDRSDEKLDHVIEVINIKNEQQDEKIANLNTKVELNTSNINNTQKEVKGLKKSAWGFFITILGAISSTIVKLIFWK